MKNIYYIFILSFFIFSFGLTQEINIKGNNRSIPNNFKYPSLNNNTNFSSTSISQSITKTFFIENLSDVQLDINSINITGIHKDFFRISKMPNLTINPRSSSSFDVTFSSSISGLKNAIINISNNDSDESLYNFNINATVKGQNNIYLFGNSNDIIKSSNQTEIQNFTDFDKVVINSIKQNNFIITNLSGSARYIKNIEIIGENSNEFEIVSQSSDLQVPNGNFISFSVRFKPNSIGKKNAKIIIKTFINSQYNNPDLIDPEFIFDISGTGTDYKLCENQEVQVIEYQDFESENKTWKYNIESDANALIDSRKLRVGTNERDTFIGTKSFLFSSNENGILKDGILTFNPINTSKYTNINLEFRVASFGLQGNDGADLEDIIFVETSTDNGENWSNEAILSGFNNARWDFNSAGIIDAYYSGNNYAFSTDSRPGLNVTDGKSYFYVKNLPNIENLMVRIIARNNQMNEFWAIDDIYLKAQVQSQTIWNGNYWSENLSNTKKVVINADFNSEFNGNIIGCSCEVNDSKVVINKNQFIDIQSDIIINGDSEIILEPNANLVQHNEDAKNPNVKIKTITRQIGNHVWIHRSLPIKNENILNQINFQEFDYDDSNQPFDFFRKNDIFYLHNKFGWIKAKENNLFPGKGFILRTGGQRYTNFKPSVGNAFRNETLNQRTLNFFGKINNGKIDVPIHYKEDGTDYEKAGANQNLIGNPYPSIIDSYAFIEKNQDVFDGYIRFWVSPLIENHTGKYPTKTGFATLNLMGSVSPDKNFEANRYIAISQGFSVYSIKDGNIYFDNSMRVSQVEDPKNITSLVDSNQNKIWLKLRNINTQDYNQILIGYDKNSTKKIDKFYDAPVDQEDTFKFYSLIDNKKIIINGNGTFEKEDVIPIGFELNEYKNQIFEISLEKIQGQELENNSIFLKDKQENIIYDLKKSNYTFSSDLKEDSNRFEILFENKNLSTENIFKNKEDLYINYKENKIIINDSKILKNLEIYNLNGKLIYIENEINKNKVIIKHNFNESIYIIKINYLDNNIRTKKIIKQN